jgi:hypothetical protein
MAGRSRLNECFDNGCAERAGPAGYDDVAIL